ncbi:MAG: hypothetical protein AABZ47_04875 [Planctomycetota bacterium]
MLVKQTNSFAIGVLAASMLIAGCMATPVSRTHEATTRWDAHRTRMLLVSDSRTPTNPPPVSLPMPNPNPADQGTTKTVAPATDANAEKEQAAAESPTSLAKPQYTAPSQALRILLSAFVGVVSTIPNESGAAAAKEASEMLDIAVPQLPAGGRLGLAALPPGIGDSLGGRPGLQRGPAIGLGLARNPNLFAQPQTNRVSGPLGRCVDLTRAGFFSGSQTQCQQHFRSDRP